MKKNAKLDEIDELLPHYDFSEGVRGKYAERYRKGTNVVLLDPDVARMFPDSDIINRVLRAVGDLVKAARPERKRV